MKKAVAGKDVIARNVDEARRLTMPPEFPPNSAVIVRRIDDDTWVVTVNRASKLYKVVLVPQIDKLPDDPRWEAKEAQLAGHLAKNLPPFED